MAAVLSASPQIERFLEDHEGYAAEFDIFTSNALQLAAMNLGDRVHDADDTLAAGMWRFSAWISARKHGGLSAYDTEETPVFVGPHADPQTEELRAVFRLLNDLNSSVPEDPKAGGELELLSQLFATHLLEVSLVAKGASPYYEGDMVKQARRMNAVFRLSFRHPSKMQLTKAERELVVGLVQASIENMRRDFEAGAFPPSIFYSTLERFGEWKKRRRDNEEL